MKKYNFLEHTADVMVEAFGENLEELFTNAALATTETMVDLPTLTKEEDHHIILESDDLEELLYDFLSELIFLKDTEQLLFKDFILV